MSERKIILFLLGATLLFNACSVSRRAETIVRSDLDRTGGGNIIEICEKNNISGKDLIISRVRIEYRSAETSRSVNAFVKQNKEGDILVSLRSFAGLEVARIYTTRDSIKIYDRLNSTLYIQSSDYLERKIGLNYDEVGLLWGDLPKEYTREMYITNKGTQHQYMMEKNNREYKMLLDSSAIKIRELIVSGSKYGNTRLLYDDYTDNSGLVYPEKTRLEIEKGEISIEMKFSGVKNEKIKSMKFTTGDRIKVVVLK